MTRTQLSQLEQALCQNFDIPVDNLTVSRQGAGVRVMCWERYGVSEREIEKFVRGRMPGVKCQVLTMKHTD